MRIVGISAFYHDSAAALIRDGHIIAAAQEERFTRTKHDAGFPRHALASCLAEEGVSLDEVDRIVFYEKPFVKFERLLETYLAFAPRGLASFRLAIPLWVREKLFQKSLLVRELTRFGRRRDVERRLLFAEHHLSHAASAFFPSPFDEAAVLTMDGVGEWATTTVSVGQGRRLEIIKEIHFPHSLGLLYSAFTSYLGFKVNSGEYKVMGLAPYGEPRYAQRIRDRLIDVKPDGSFRLNLGYFNYCTGLTMTRPAFAELFDGPPRRPDEPLTTRHMDVAASIQAALDDIVLRLTRAIAEATGLPNLCLAGGVALNCVANGTMLRDGRFQRLWIQPAAGDAGGSVGAALAAYHLYGGQARVAGDQPDGMQGSFLGPAFSQQEIERRLTDSGAAFGVLEEPALIDACVETLCEGKALGWFQGRMEFGPRALGARSILGDPRSPTMQSRLNLKIKFRESFRPFAPSVLKADAPDWFSLDVESPYMLLVADVLPSRRRPLSEEEQRLQGLDRLKAPRSSIPAVTHVDDSARIQTVEAGTNPLYHRLLEAFKARTGCPVLVNTSFNVRGEPIVCTPEDAFRCFMGTNLDALAIGRCFLTKDAQRAAPQPQYAAAFAPD